jgi:uncharacterized membrane protein
MAEVQTSIDVEMPAQSVYNQWTQFEDFPRFLEGVESVTQLSDSRLHWVAKVAGVKREWDAKITTQEPDRCIAWQSLDGANNAGVVMFESLDPMRTRVTLRLEFDPDGFVEKAGDALGLWQRRVEGDLERFKAFIEERGAESGEWRGKIEGGRVIELDEKKSIDPDVGTEHAEYPQVTTGTSSPTYPDR